MEPIDLQARANRIVKARQRGLQEARKARARAIRVSVGGGRHAPGTTATPLDRRVEARRKKAKQAKASRRANRR